MASALNTKINSYTLRRGIEFNDSTTSTTPTRTGTAGNGTFTSVLPTYSTNGPAGGAGSWVFTGSATTSANTQYLRNATSTSTTEGLSYNDADWSMGFWFKVPVWNSGSSNSAQTIFNAIGTGSGITIAMAGSGFTTPRALTITSGNTTYVTSSLNINQWYYFAARRTAGNTEIYLDGTLLTTISSATTATVSSLIFGDSGRTIPNNGSFQIANYYTTDYSIINATAISEIWTIGNSNPSINITITDIPGTATALMVESMLSAIKNITINETPSTATALIQHPTIIVVTPDHTEITTAFAGSATFPDSTITATKFVNNVISGALEASAIIGDNIIITGGTDVSNSIPQMTATALIVEPLMPPAPMIASATMPNPVITVPESYFNYVMQNNPLIYFNTFPTGNSTAYPNYGSLTLGTIDKGPIGSSAGNLNQQASGAPLSNVGDGFSLGISTGGSDEFNYYDQSNYSTTLSNVYVTKNWTHDFWYKPSNNSTYNYSDDVLTLNLVHTANTGVSMAITFRSTTGSTINATIANTNFYLTNSNWHNITLVASNWSSTQIKFDLYIDSLFVGTTLQTFNHTFAGIFAQMDQLSSEMTWTLYGGGNSATLWDEIAIYPSSLSSQTINTKYNFVDHLSPNKNIVADPFEADALINNGIVVVVANTNIPAIPITASSLFVNPIVIPGRVINIAATSLTASATNIDATVYWGWTIPTTPMISSAESKEGFVLNDIYYQYVQTNIAPYRYVSFDAVNTLFDYGIDNDYSVAPTTVGGTIVNPDLGINGKSAKTAGTSYITDGVILNESEWNDSWGTGQNSYHSAFWFQRALDDASTTGLRVLWNLNGYKDNQHVVLYQYQGKLHMQFNNGSGTWIEQDTVNGLDLFDYNRHFIVIEFDHTNVNNNTVRLYVDAVLKMTVNLGTYTGSTTNASSADSGPNNEANNHPRLSVGCLITPFAATALPVIPTNTKLIIDEVYWDKNAISSTTITNLFNIMPGKFNINKTADPMLASDEFVMPAFATTVNFVTSPFITSAGLVQPLITADREVIYNAIVMTATGLMANAEVNENRTIVVDFMQAVATFNDPGVKITIPGGPMLASVEIANRPLEQNSLTPLSEGIKVNGYITWLRIQPWAAWLRATDSNTIIPMKEVV